MTEKIQGMWQAISAMFEIAMDKGGGWLMAFGVLALIYVLVDAHGTTFLESQKMYQEEMLKHHRALVEEWKINNQHEAELIAHIKKLLDELPKQ